MPSEIITVSEGGGQNIQADLAAILEDTGTTLPAALTALFDLRLKTFEASTYVNVPTHSDAFTYGAWTELIASADFDADAMMVALGLGSGSKTVEKTDLSIGVGAAASEVEIYEIPWGRQESVAASESFQSLPFMFYTNQISSGDRIALRVRDSLAASAHNYHAKIVILENA